MEKYMFASSLVLLIALVCIATFGAVGNLRAKR